MRMLAKLAALLLLIAGTAQAQSYTACETLIKPVPLSPATNNSWGPQLNTNFDLIDTSLAAGINISVAGASNLILQSFQGAPDQARYRYYNFTGVMTGNVVVFFPANRCRQFIASNNTTGSFSLTIAAGSGSALGSTIVIPQGSTLSVYSDGTNVINVSNGTGTVTNTIFNTLTQLRANNSPFLQAFVLGYSAVADGGGGTFVLNSTDTTSADNGTTIIVDTGGHRWYRMTGWPSYFAQTIAAIEALPIPTAATGFSVTLGGYRTIGDMPPATYTLSSTPCTINGGQGDGGGQLPAQNAGCWNIAPQAVWNPKWWGARQDVNKLLNPVTVVTTTASSCSVKIVSTQTGFSGFMQAANAGERIVFTNAVPGSGNSPTYAGTIISVQNPTNLTVSAPCPTLTSNTNQVVYYGHDDAAAVNAAINYIGTLTVPNASGLPELNMGGLATGVYSTPVNMNQSMTIRNASFVALGADFLPTRTTGVVEVNGFFSALRESSSDCAYLPVNCIYSNSNGTLLITDTRAKNWLGSGTTSVTFTGSSTDEAELTGAWIDGCASGTTFGFACTLHVGSATGLIQPGQTVYDSAGHIPAGTYITGFGDNQSFGKVGTYTVYNINSSPAFGNSGSTESMSTLGLDVAVTSCSSSNQSTTQPSPGLINHGLGVVIPTRTFIVGCFTHVNSGDPPTHIVLNKAPLQPFTNTSLTFVADSNGLYFGPSAGLTVINFTTDQEQFSGIAGNNYGCSVYDDSGGGTQFKGRTNAFQGAALYCIGPDGGDNEFESAFGETNWGPTSTFCCEIDAPSIMVMDGANSTIFDSPNIGGMVQIFAINGGPNVTINDPQYPINGGSIIYAPGDQIWAYCEINCSPNKLITRPFRANGQIFSSSNQQNAPNFIALTTGAHGAWPALTSQQLNLLPNLNGALIPYAGLMGIPFGIDMGTSIVKNAENLITLTSSSVVLRETDCGNHYNFNNGSTFTVTVPPNLGTNLSQAAIKSDCTIEFIASNGTGGTLVAGSGATLYVNGTPTSPITLGENRWYRLKCFANADAQHPFCVVGED